MLHGFVIKITAGGERKKRQMTVTKFVQLMFVLSLQKIKLCRAQFQIRYVSFADKPPQKPPVLSPKPNPELVKRLSFNSRKSDTASNSSASSSPASNRAATTTSSKASAAAVPSLKSPQLPTAATASSGNSIVRKLSAEFDSKASKNVQPPPNFSKPNLTSPSATSNKFLASQPQSLNSLEKSLFPSLEPSEVSKVDEEFDRITNESRLDSLLSKGADAKLDALLDEEPEVIVPPPRVTSISGGSKPAAASGVVEAVPFIDDDSSSTSSNNSTVIKSNNKQQQHSLNLNLNSVYKPTRSTKSAAGEKQSGSPAPLAEAENGFASPSSDQPKHVSKIEVNENNAEAADDDLQDEIHFDPTISSGQLGFKEVKMELYCINNKVIVLCIL